MNQVPPPGYYPPPAYPQYYPQAPRNNGQTPAARAVRIAFSILAPALWLLALVLPAYNDEVLGVLCLGFGWSMLFTGNFLAFLAWLSWLPFWISFFFFVIGNKRKTAAMVLAGISLAMSLGALTVSEVAANEGGSMHPAHPAYGMFVWMAAHLLLLTGSAILTFISPTAEMQQPVYYPPPQPYYPPPSPNSWMPPPPAQQQQWPPQHPPHDPYANPSQETQVPPWNSKV